MSNFGELYSQYYDLLYREKNYEAEAGYIINLIRKYAPASNTIFELGCGTGIHATYFAKAGYKLFGIDISDEMLARANHNKAKFIDSLDFAKGDIETFKTGKKFDVAISLFHVMCYLNSNQSLLTTFRNVNENLKEDGLFIFDCWYGPGVLSDPPTIRVKRLENENLEITRIAEPELFPEKNVSHVNYSLFIKNKSTEEITVTKEQHSIRYFFSPEMELLLSQCGFNIIDSFRYLTEEAPQLDTWNVVFICKKQR
jgi:SAM-dependent methyltransferase